MQEKNLPSPNVGGTGFHLRRVAAKAISSLEISAARYPGNVHPNASDLRAFFSACANACAPFDATPAEEDA